MALVFAALLLAAVLAWLDVGLVRSRLNATSTVGPAHQEANLSSTAPNAVLTIHVEGSDQLRKPLLDQMVVAMVDAGYAPRVEAAGAAPSGRPGDGPILVVQMVEEWMLWTPLFSRARLMVAVSYQQGDGPDAEHNMALSGTVEIRQAAYGLMSYPAYVRELARGSAWRIRRALDRASG